MKLRGPIPAVASDFTAQDANQTAVQGIVSFVEYATSTYQIVSYTTTAAFGSYSTTLQRSITSFERLPDTKALGVQPMRVQVERIPRAMTLKDFAYRYRSTIPLAELALINGPDTTATLAAGSSAKWVRR